jgi:uncharacterized protein (TIGR02646 family)
MILVKRSAIPPKLKVAAKKELHDILEHFEKRLRKGDFSFKAYKSDGVTQALTAMFHGKCAFCESQIRAVQPNDIEHYRPKSEVLIGGKKCKPGYYWLAAKWDNLLASCIYCNRPNRHEPAPGRKGNSG